MAVFLEDGGDQADRLARSVAEEGILIARRRWTKGVSQLIQVAPVDKNLRAIEHRTPLVHGVQVMDGNAFRYEGVQDGAYYGFQPTGRTLHFTSCDIFRLRDGRIAEHWGMGDIAGVIAQLKRA